MTEKEIIPVEEILATGIHIGVKYRTAFMKPYVYKIRPDGLSVLDTEKIIKQVENAARFLANYEPEEILVVSRRESGWKPVEKFAETTGVKTITGRYVPGSITNPDYEDYVEPRIVVLSDPWTDRQVLRDAFKISVPIIALCDSNNITRNVDLCIPCNNKGKKSVALVYWLLAREYLKNRKKIKTNKEFKPTLDDFAQK